MAVAEQLDSQFDGEPDSGPATLRACRVGAGVSQELLARRAGLSTRTVRYLESAGAHSPRQRTLERLSDALRLPAEQRHQLLVAYQLVPGPHNGNTPSLLSGSPSVDAASTSRSSRCATSARTGCAAASTSPTSIRR